MTRGHLVEAEGDDPSESRALAITHLDGWELDASRLMDRIRTALGADGAVTELQGAPGVWDIGERSLGPVRVRAFCVLRKPDGAEHKLAQRLQQYSGGASRVLVIVPPGCEARTGHAEVEFGRDGDPAADLLPRTAAALQLEEHLPVTEQADPDVRLVIDTKRGNAHLDGVPLSFVNGQGQSFKMLTALARAGGEVVSRDDLNTLLSPNANTKDTAKSVRRRLGEEIETSFRHAHRNVPNTKELFVSQGGGYALRVKACVA